MFKLEIQDTKLNGLKLVGFDRFVDLRGFFTELYRKSDIEQVPGMKRFTETGVTQINESLSKKGVVRGLHFQHSPYMYKFIRPATGKIIVIAVDVRDGSPDFGKAELVELEATPDRPKDYSLYIPAGFALGFLVEDDSLVQYFICGEYNQDGEIQISPIASDIDFSTADQNLVKKYLDLATKTNLLSEKDKAAMSVTQWRNDPRKSNFKFEELKTL